MDQQVEKKYVAADILRKRKKDIERIQHKVNLRIQKMKERNAKPTSQHLTPEFLVQNYRAQQNAYATFKKRSHKIARDTTEVQKDRVILAVRIRGFKDISAEQTKILRIFKLPTINSATFIKMSTPSLKRLKRVENYVTYGYPSKKVISEMIYKRANAKINGKRVHIDNNKKVEDNLGNLGIICLEDLVNEISGLGPNFQAVQKFLWSFKLTTKEDGWDQKKITKPFSNGGEWGNREEKINDLILKMI